MNENFYVDDFICSVDSDEEARQVYHEAKLILSEASMNLTKWKTNSNALKEEIETVTSKEVKLGFPDSSSKVLGLKYNSSKDLFTFSPETIVEASHSNEPTKRTVLQISSKLFDPIANWYHCPGNQNPADKITRGCSVKQLSQDNSWKFGPPWLSDFKSSWPVQENSSICCDSEESCSMCCESDIVPVFNCAVNKSILNIENFSTLRRLLRVTSLVFRFIYNARNSNNRKSGPITSSETSKALIYFIKMSQENSFSSEINKIKLNKSVNKNSKLCNFNVRIDDDNILRIKSRLSNSSLDVYEKHPIILSNDYFASLIVYDCHEKVLHNGVNETLIQVRCKFWILKARQFIKSIVYNCRVCKKFHAKSGGQNIVPLPNDRIEKSQPFEIAGVDFAGPLYLKEEKFQLEWKFIVEGAPWWGGFWERLVRSVKNCLKCVLGKTSLMYEELNTVLIEVEAVINSRPLTYVYNDVNEPDPLTPSHFTVGSRLTTLPSPKLNANSINVELTKKWKYRQLLLDHFWKRFFKEYLLELRSVMFTKQ
ncbi:integrase catalytic domain-containing protein [Trichonephila clavata]|uniref:Integrase catalytic domain-containing protein n=1 Tax=Trichonephila clavata TaxID=2740835 RepID=A0A8X6L9J1_TRICU|nr:integrase catalytic domain-containing protein [Trichonephila clavata]